MKRFLFAIATFIVTSSAFAAHDPVTDINWFECNPYGAEQKFKVWTEKTMNGKQIITVGTLGKSGVEGIEKFVGSRFETDDTVDITSYDRTVTILVVNSFDGEFYAGELAIYKNGVFVKQLLACKEFVPAIPN